MSRETSCPHEWVARRSSGLLARSIAQSAQFCNPNLQLLTHLESAVFSALASGFVLSRKVEVHLRLCLWVFTWHSLEQYRTKLGEQKVRRCPIENSATNRHRLHFLTLSLPTYTLQQLHAPLVLSVLDAFLDASQWFARGLRNHGQKKTFIPMSGGRQFKATLRVVENDGGEASPSASPHRHTPLVQCQFNHGLG